MHIRVFPNTRKWETWLAANKEQRDLTEEEIRFALSLLRYMTSYIELKPVYFALLPVGLILGLAYSLCPLPYPELVLSATVLATLPGLYTFVESLLVRRAIRLSGMQSESSRLKYTQDGFYLQLKRFQHEWTRF